jgi:hypothetical protein
MTVGSSLYQLALKYWSEGRTVDAKRVGIQALALLRQEPAGSDLTAAMEQTLREIDAELDQPA